MRVNEMLRSAQESVMSALFTFSLAYERSPVLGSVVDDLSDLRLPARKDLGIEFVHIPRLGEASGFSLHGALMARPQVASYGLVKVNVASPSVSGSVVVSEAHARQLEWMLERQAAVSGVVSEIPDELFGRLVGKRPSRLTDNPADK